MVNANELARELRERINAHLEWLLVRASGRTFPLHRDEIQVRAVDDAICLGALEDSGFGVWRVQSLSNEVGELLLDVGRNSSTETIRLVPRMPARDLSANIELARLERANLIGAVAVGAFPNISLTRVALNIDNGRLAQIMLREGAVKNLAVMSDVTGTMTHEAVMTAAMLWGEKLRRRKKPINEVWLVGQKKQARNLQKLLALLNQSVASRFRILEISNDAESPKLKELKRLELSTLWRERSRPVRLPHAIAISQTARSIVDRAPASTDVINSKHGETIRFLGLAFARVRSIARRETAWFGFDRSRTMLTDETWPRLTDLLNDLELYRRQDTPNKRHEFYRATPEAWLESILRRDIRQLDANLILSPLYNQFRTVSDKIDLLAIRRDGRLVIIEIKTSPDRETVFQAADYWRKIELQRRRGALRAAFPDMKIVDKPALIYAVAPALSFHRDFGYFAQTLRPEIEVWRFELREDWRAEIKVLTRRDYRT